MPRRISSDKLSAKQEHAFVDLILTNYQEDWGSKIAQAGKKHQNWKNLIKWYDGSASKEYWRSSFTPNVIAPVIELLAAAYVGESPRAYFVPQEADDRDTANTINEVYENDWLVGNTNAVLYRAILFKCILGTTAVMPYYDATQRRLMRRYVNPANITIDRRCSDPQGKTARRFYYVTVKPIKELMKQYPAAFKPKKGREYADLASSEWSDIYDDEFIFAPNVPFPAMRFSNPPGMGAAVTNPNDVPDGFRDHPKAKAEYIECWVRDIDEYGTLFPKAVKEELKTWKNKSVLVRIAGQRILAIDENEATDGDFPVTFFHNIPQQDTFWSRGWVERLVTFQMNSDIMHTRFTEWMKKLNAPPWIHDKKYGDAPSRIPYSTEQVISIMGGINALQPMKLDAPPGIMLEFLNYCATSGPAHASGANEASQGIRQPGVIAAQAVKEYASTFYKRSEPIRQCDMDAIANDARLYMDMACRYYDEEYVSRVVGKFFGRGWDSLRKKASGKLDVKAMIMESPMRDPQESMNTASQIINLGIFDETKPLDQRIALAEMAAPYWPRARRIGADLEKEKKQKIRDIAEGKVPPPAPPPDPNAMPPAQGMEPAPAPMEAMV